MRTVKLKELENKNFEEGEKILLKAGYVQQDSARDDGVDCDYIFDTYFKLFDDDDEEVDVKSFVQHMNVNSDPLNDDGSEDFVVRELWVEL